MNETKVKCTVPESWWELKVHAISIVGFRWFIKCVSFFSLFSLSNYWDLAV